MTNALPTSTGTTSLAFHRLRVTHVRPLTDDSVEISFDVPQQLVEAFAFEPGQHVAVRMHVDGQEHRRNYSITSAAGDPVLRIGVRRTTGGVVSTLLTSNLGSGDELDVMTPAGRFTAPVDPTAARHWLLVAAGSGITPVMSILRTVLRDEPRSSVTLLYCNRSVSTIMFRDEIDDLKSHCMERLSVLHFLTRERRNVGLFDGRITPEKLRTLWNSTLDGSRVEHAFVCGPQQLTIAARQTLLELGAPHVHVELFGTDAPRTGSAAPAAPAPDAAVVAHADVVLHGIESTIELHEGERVLDAARRAGLDVPFACTGGVCATCRAHVSEGSVEMAVNYALDEDEIERGFALTCQSVPTTPQIRVDYDRH